MTKPEWPVISDGAQYELIWSGEIRYHGAMDYEQAKADLRERYPDWQIWYVPATSGAPYWNARPKLSLQAHSPGELEQMIQAAQPVPNGFDSDWGYPR